MARKFNPLAALVRPPRGKFAEKSERAIAEVAVSGPGYSGINVISIRARRVLIRTRYVTWRPGDGVSAHFQD